MAIPTRAEIDAAIRERLAADPGFREVLISDPRGAIASLTGVALPDFIDVQVHEETLTELHVVIPAPQASEGELSEDDLESVAGGRVRKSASTTTII